MRKIIIHHILVWDSEIQSRGQDLRSRTRCRPWILNLVPSVAFHYPTLVILNDTINLISIPQRSLNSVTFRQFSYRVLLNFLWFIFLFLILCIYVFPEYLIFNFIQILLIVYISVVGFLLIVLIFFIKIHLNTCLLSLFCFCLFLLVFLRRGWFLFLFFVFV